MTDAEELRRQLLLFRAIGISKLMLSLGFKQPTMGSEHWRAAMPFRCRPGSRSSNAISMSKYFSAGK